MGLISDERFEALQNKLALIDKEITRVWNVNLGPSKELNGYLEECGTEPISSGIKLAQLIRRPQLSYEGLNFIDPDRPELPEQVKEQVELQIKYEGIYKIQLEQVEAMRKLEKKSP